MCATPAAAQQEASAYHHAFTSSDNCIACHSNITDADGNDVSIGYSWRATMMANSARDPYWQAAVRRELMDRPELRTEIEDTCSICHMPMATTLARARGRSGTVFDHLQGTATDPVETQLGADGVSCTVCHQIQADGFGEPSSFDGGYVIDVKSPGARQISGPFDVDGGRARIMTSASNFEPGVGAHIQRSELCATCHTLFTAAVGGNGQIIGQFPEQVPYLEWRNSTYEDTHSCQDCHMPTLADATPISSVLGEPREGYSQHAFRGGNAFMLRVLSQFRDELNVTAPADELEAAVAGTLEHLSISTARVDIASAEQSDSGLLLDIDVTNLAGHKLPTAYPSRRAWLHVTVSDQSGVVLFESGAPQRDGSIAGNDNDLDGSRFEPHYEEIVSADQVQIYEPIVVDYKDEITTSLLSGARYAKDNRLLPAGFDKSGAADEVAVRGAARDHDGFVAGTDRIRYKIDLAKSSGVLRVSVQLLFQAIGYRWAQNLAEYDSFETDRFVGYFSQNASDSGVLLAEANTRVGWD